MSVSYTHLDVYKRQNVKINLESIKDEEFVKETSKEVEVLEKKAIAFEQKIFTLNNAPKTAVLAIMVATKASVTAVLLPFTTIVSAKGRTS